MYKHLVSLTNRIGMFSFVKILDNLFTAAASPAMANKLERFPIDGVYSGRLQYGRHI